MKTPVELAQLLAQYEDASTAIAVYKEANLAIAEYEEVKKAALALAESSMVDSGEAHLNALVGSAGWTTPKTPQLDKEAWANAILEDHNLATVERNFKAAEKVLKRWQEPYMKLAARRFFIR
jgi:hypothetical protein